MFTQTKKRVSLIKMCVSRNPVKVLNVFFFSVSGLSCLWTSDLLRVHITAARVDEVQHHVGATSLGPVVYRRTIGVVVLQSQMHTHTGK